DDQSRNWAALGVQGLAPYKFETALTAYVSDDGQSQFSAEAEYDLLLTNDLVVKPSVALSAFGKNDPERGEGSGLSTIEAGLRLKYRITRQFAPYVGVSREHSFGKSADYRRHRNQPVADTRWVAGVSLWF